MKAWTLEDRAHFDSLMAGYWQAWHKASPATKTLYMERLESYGFPALQRALKNVKAAQEFDRVPGLQIVLSAVGDEERRVSWRDKSRGGNFKSPQDAELARLSAACVEIWDSTGASWRFLHLEDLQTGVYAFGLDCESANAFIPWEVLPAGQQDRLRGEGLQAIYARGTPTDERTASKRASSDVLAGGSNP